MKIYIFYFNRKGNFWHVVFQCDKKIIQFIGTILSLVFLKTYLDICYFQKVVSLSL